MTAVAACGYTALASAGVAEAESHTPHRNVRVPDDTWIPFGFVAGKRGRSEWVKEFIGWVVEDPQLWRDVRSIAAAKGDDLGALVLAALRRYRARNVDLLND